MRAAAPAPAAQLLLVLARVAGRVTERLLRQRPRRARGVARPPRELLGVRPCGGGGPARLIARPPGGLLDVGPRHLGDIARRLLCRLGELPERLAERGPLGNRALRLLTWVLILAVCRRLPSARVHLPAPVPSAPPALSPVFPAPPTRR